MSLDFKPLIAVFLFHIWIYCADADCPAYYTQSGTKCFQAYDDTKNWIDAMNFCKIAQGSLARIDNENDQTIITNLVEASQDGSKTINLTTGNDYHYHYMHDQGLDITGKTSIVFEVMNCNDAHVALSQTKGDDSHNTYEIVLGGWGNTQSVIRTCKQCTNHATSHTNHFDSCTGYRAFWISWDSGIKVGRGRIVGHDMFMSWTDPSPHPVNYIAFATGWGATGHWKFQIGNTKPGIFWIGASNSGTHSFNQWLWFPSKAPLGFKNWAPNKPFNIQNNHCAYVDPNNFGLWSNDICSVKMNYICQVASFNNH